MLAPWLPMPARVTPESLRLQAKQVREDAEKKARGLEQLADVLEAHDELHDVIGQIAAKTGESRAAVIRDLTSDSESTDNPQTVSSPTVSSAELARGMAKSKSKRHPFVRALYERKKTVKEWAQARGVPVASVSSWVSKGPGARRIPMRWAKAIEQELGIPATLASWKNGITE